MEEFKYFNEEWNNQIQCYCNLPQSNKFTGRCKNCNGIIKQPKDKDVYKYTK